MFVHDAAARSQVQVIPVPCDDIVHARFRQHVRPGRPPPELLRRLEEAARTQRELGRRVAAVLLSNPENPLACCYSHEMLRWVARWCEGEGVHLVVDELYALGGGEAFTSALSLELGDMLGNVHVLWGMSKVSREGRHNTHWRRLRLSSTNASLLVVGFRSGWLSSGVPSDVQPAALPGHENMQVSILPGVLELKRQY